MILSPYRNPPYRTPTPKEDSLSPPAQPSPKRKRADSGSARASTPLRVETSQSDESTNEGRLASPRSKVVERLRDLDLEAQSPQVISPNQEVTGAPRKRLRRNVPLSRTSPGYDVEDGGFLTPEPSSSQQAIHSRSTSPLEIGETPDCRVRVTASPERSPGLAFIFGQANDMSSLAGGNDDHAEEVRAKRLPSPPPPTPTPRKSLLTAAAADIVDRAFLASSSGDDDASIDQIALTWQDDEITGQDIDMTLPDDADGLGINGIGFKPTPAMAYARSQKRKQQISDWKAREARDARQKRMQRRRGAEPRSDPVMQKRSVRFEDVG